MISWTNAVILSAISCTIWIYVTVTFYPEFAASMIGELVIPIKDIYVEYELPLPSDLTSIAIYGLIPMLVIVFVKIFLHLPLVIKQIMIVMNADIRSSTIEYPLFKD